jgi:hypothetical protein
MDLFWCLVVIYTAFYLCLCLIRDEAAILALPTFMESYLVFNDHWNKTMTTSLASPNLQKFVEFQNPTLATKITLHDGWTCSFVIYRQEGLTYLATFPKIWLSGFSLGRQVWEGWIGSLTGSG